MIYLQFNRFLFSYCSLRHLNMNQLNGTIPPLGNLTLLRDLYASFFLATHLTWWAIIQIDFTPNRFLFSFCGVALTGTLTRISSPAPSRLSSATSLSCNSCTLTIELLFYNIYCRLYVKVCPIRRGETVPISNYLDSWKAKPRAKRCICHCSPKLIRPTRRESTLSIVWFSFINYIPLSGPSSRISWLVPSRLSSVTSLSSTFCTLRI